MAFVVRVVGAGNQVSSALFVEQVFKSCFYSDRVQLIIKLSGNGTGDRFFCWE